MRERRREGEIESKRVEERVRETKTRIEREREKEQDRLGEAREEENKIKMWEGEI